MAREFCDFERDRSPAFIAVVVISFFMGPLIGAISNAINVEISPHFFEVQLGLGSLANVWLASVAQGVREGLLFGLAYTLIFAIAAAVITRAYASFWFLFWHVIGIVIGACGTWAVGGFIAMEMARTEMERTRVAINMDELAFAWIRGSTWGAEIGGFLCLILGIIFLRANWRRLNAT